jgi:hypothetical protein
MRYRFLYPLVVLISATLCLAQTETAPAPSASTANTDEKTGVVFNPPWLDDAVAGNATADSLKAANASSATKFHIP